MSTIGVGARYGAKDTDYDAAQALLDLQSNKNLEENADTCAGGWRDTDSKEEIEKAAKLILSCFISSKVPTIHNNITGNNDTHLPNLLLDTTKSYRQSRVIETHKACHRSRQINFDERISSNRLSSYGIEGYSKASSKRERSRNFQDAGTQTEEKYLNPNVQLMEITIKNLCERIKSLEAQLKTSLDPSVDEASYETGENDLDFSYENNDQDPDFKMTASDDTDTVRKSKYSRSSEFDSSAFNDSRSRQTNRSIVYRGVLKNHNTNSYDSVPIGDGNATVPSRLLKQINWNSYSSATRKLLTAVFSRRILATHSLTGKPSPAFPNKPAKKRLNPTLVNDIVQTVVERCRVPENVVRTSITTKCADESKMFRTREKNKKKRSNKNNRENVSPTSDSESDDF